MVLAKIGRYRPSHGFCRKNSEPNPTGYLGKRSRTSVSIAPLVVNGAVMWLLKKPAWEQGQSVLLSSAASPAGIR